MIIKATSHTIRNIWIVFLFIIIVLLVFIGTLTQGISFDSLTIPNIKVHQLYIKLDKKLIVHIQELAINKETQTDTSLEESATIIKNFPLLHQFFSEITIEKLTYANEEIKLIFKENIFYLDSKHLSVNLKITPMDKLKIDIDIQEANFKDFSLQLSGKASLNFKNELYNFEGNFETFGMKGIALFDIKNKLLTYHLQTENFTNVELSNLMDFIVTKVELDPIAKGWIHKNIVAQTYQLHFIEGKFDLHSYDYYPLEMKGSATAKDALVSFEPTVPPAHVEEIGILFENDKLIFDVKNATYEKKSVQKADVYIYNLLGKGTGIVVDLDVIARLDKDIHKILHAFKIDVPITQTSGETKAKVTLDIKFLPFDINATGKFSTQKSNFKLSDVEMYTKEAFISLDNYLVYLDKTNMRYKNLFDITTTGLFDAKTQKFNGKADINALSLDFNGAKLLETKNLKEQSATMSIEENTTRIIIPELETILQFEPKNNFFSFENLSKIESLSPFMQENGLHQGRVLVTTQNFEKFQATILAQDFSTPLLINDTVVKDFEVKLSTDTITLDAHTIDKKISLHLDKQITLHVKDLNISIPKGDSPLESPIKITILGENSSFIDTQSNRTILSDNYTLNIYQDVMSLHSKYQKSSFEYDKTKKNLSIIGTSMDANFSNHMLNKNYFHEGDFSLQLDGKDDKHLKGTFIMHQTAIQELKFFDNLMATINAIPSLVVFSDPKFNQGGYFVKDGYIEFTREGEIITIIDMKLTGNNADIVGSGTINFDTNQMALKLQIRTLKTFSNIIDWIPIVGGLVLGEDKRISTNVDVIGEIDDPQIKTNLVLDTLKSPLHIIKRTLELPLEIFK
ncbi:MAG: AsmA-like C-terminal domain-containing protein [Campylobacteraceae bacterium]|nr:AsmA-like C-terminal domain-containing protein [Campylobacteraceae bacterium]